MRSQKRILVSGLVAIMALLLVFAGCSDDNSATSSGSGTNTGSLSDPEFVAVRAQIDAMADSTVTFFMHGLNALQGISETELPVQYAVDPDGDDEVNTQYDDGWHVIAVSNLAASNDKYWIRDSIQFLRNGSPQRSSDNAHSMSYVHRWYQKVATGNTTDTADGRASLTFGSFYQDNTTVGGTSETSVYEYKVHSDSTVVRSYDLDVTLSSFKIGESGLPGATSDLDDASNCPCEGTIEADVTATYQKNSNSATTTEWDVEATFSNGTLSVEVTSGNTVWQYTRDMCNPPSN